MSELEQAIRERFAALPHVVSVETLIETVTRVTVTIDAEWLAQAPRDAVYEVYWAMAEAHPEASFDLRLCNIRAPRREIAVLD